MKQQLHLDILEDAFSRQLELSAKGKLNIEIALEAMLSFFDNYEVANLDHGYIDNDMLLFQYGIYDWFDGKGSNFQIGITRQFKMSDDQDEFYQLAVSLFFDPQEFETLNHCNHWSIDFASLREWIETITNTEGYRTAKSREPKFYELTLNMT